MIELRYGADPRYPIHKINLGDNNAVAFVPEGFAPPGTSMDILYSTGRPGLDGTRRITSRKNNTQASITYHIKDGNSAAAVGELQRQINLFINRVKNYQENGQGHPVWLAYRFPDGLTLPDPIAGQLNSFMELLDLAIPQWPAALHIPNLINNGIALNVVCQLTLAPTSQGYKQKLGMASGSVIQMQDGVFLGADVTRNNAGPQLSDFYSTQTTSFDNGWTFDTELRHIQETRDSYSLTFNSAVQVSNYDNAVHQATASSMTLAAGSSVIGCFARKLDGSAVANTDIKIYHSSGALSTTVRSLANMPGYEDWYICFGTATTTTGANTIGFEVQVKKSVIVDKVFAQDRNNASYADPLWPGHPDLDLGYDWDGGAYQTNIGSSNGRITYTFSEALGDTFTVSIWVKPLWSTPNIDTSKNMRLIKFTDNVGLVTNSFELYYDVSASGIVLTKTIDGTSNSATLSASFSRYTWTHILLSGSGDDIAAYVNGSLDNTVTVAGSFSDGYIDIGDVSTADANGTGPECVFDGFRVWDQTLSSANITGIYNAENPIKNRNGHIGGPACLWSSDAKGTVTQAEQTTAANYVVLLGLPGDDAGKLALEIAPPTSSASRDYYLARKAYPHAFDPSGLFWHYPNTNTGSIAAGSQDTATIDVDETHADALRGLNKYVGRFYTTDGGTATTDTDLFYQEGSADWVPSAVIQPDSATEFRAYSESQKLFSWGRNPRDLKLGMVVKNVSSTSMTGYLYWLALLPAPILVLKCEKDTFPTVATGDKIIYEDGRAYLQDDSSNDEKLANFAVFGDGGAFTAEPGQYNYIFVIQGEHDVAYTASLSAKIEAYYTPRLKLAGGWIA